MRPDERTILRGAVGPSSLRLLAAVALALSLGACSTVKVKVDPELLAEEGERSAAALVAASGDGQDELGHFGARVRALLREVRDELDGGAPGDVAASYLKVAVDGHGLLEGLGGRVQPEQELELLGVYNRSLAGFMELWAGGPGAAAGSAPELSIEGERYEIVISPDSAYGAGYFDRMVAAEGVREEGVVYEAREGIGAAMVGIRERLPERGDEVSFFPWRGLHVPVTVTIDSVDRIAGGGGAGAGGVTRVSLSLRSPTLEDKVRVGGRDVPLAADFTAPIALLLVGRNETLWGLGGFFKAGQRLRQSGIFLLEPYDPDRIPVLLVHGLISVPIVWRDIIPQMMKDPEISRRYQFMVFAYPSSLPIMESAKLMRERLASFRQRYDPTGEGLLSNDIVIIGHSMGGVLCHALVADVDDRLWAEVSDVPFDSIDLAEDKKEPLREVFFFEPDPGVTRVIFASTPHRGANMAMNPLANMVSKVASLPANILTSASLMLDPQTVAALGMNREIRGKVTAVQSLAPGAPMVMALDASPYREGVIYHSIIGDRGRGDTPNSSDGVVEYWSSHQEGAASELIVPTGHGSFRHPDAIATIQRILREHAGLE